MEQVQDRILAAKNDERILEDLITENKQWILRTASQTVGRYVSDSDDEWSVALLAFTEAVQSYTPDKGSFQAFAALVIRRRLVDHLRAEDRRTAEISVSPDVFSDVRPEQDAPGAEHGLRSEILKKTARSDDDDPAGNARAEIAAMQAILKEYGFSFFDLADASPKADKTKTACATAIRALLAAETLLQSMRAKRLLPIREVSEASGVQKKILERHRKYVIAAAEILDGDFPILATYLRFVRKE